MNEFLLQTINPIAIEIGPLQVRWYGIIIASAIYIAAAINCPKRSSNVFVAS